MKTSNKLFTSKTISFLAPEDGVLTITNYPEHISMIKDESISFKVRHTLITKVSKKEVKSKENKS